MALLPRLSRSTASRKAAPPSAFLKATVKPIKGGGLLISLPPALAEGLVLGDGTAPAATDDTQTGIPESIYAILTNGVVQLSARQPTLTIPVGSADEGDWGKQGSGD